MAILKVFLRFAESLLQDSTSATALSLDKIAISYEEYAYIGARASLKAEVLERASHIPNSETMTPEESAKKWYGGKNWEKESGVFPDFVFGFEGEGGVGDGALLELKDSKDVSIASFNSTLPISRKALSVLSPMVRNAVNTWDTVQVAKEGYPDERDCYYLIRTSCKDASKVRISLVQGTFFETLPTKDLLKALWENLLPNDVTEEERKTVIDILARIDRENISSTQHIPHASIKPRLRLMSEIEAEGNPHTYPEIAPRTLNLITKLREENPEAKRRELEEWANREGLGVRWQDDSICQITHGDFTLEMSVSVLKHKRNGWHRVCQVRLPDLG